MPGSVATYFNNHIPGDADAWKIQPEDIGQMVADLLQMNPPMHITQQNRRKAFYARQIIYFNCLQNLFYLFRHPLQRRDMQGNDNTTLLKLPSDKNNN